MRESSVRLALLALSAVSGCAALIYQIVWFQASLAIGASALSLGVLPAVFLGGLCIGSLLADRSRRRAAIRCARTPQSSSGSPRSARSRSPRSRRSAASTPRGPATVSPALALRLLVAALALLPATILLGATLPAVAPSREPAGRRGVLGLFYAANIAGAVAGSLLAAFYLLSRTTRTSRRSSRSRSTSAVAAARHLARGAHGATSRSDAGSVGACRRALADPVAIGLSGMTALSGEMLWTRNLSLLFGGTVYAFALILAVFLLGLGAGSAAGAALGRRIDARRRSRGANSACAAIAGARTRSRAPCPIGRSTSRCRRRQRSRSQVDLLRTAFAIMPAALLWGASFPLALAASTSVRATRARLTAHVSSLYAANTAGTIVGALATSFVLVPALGSALTQQL